MMHHVLSQLPAYELAKGFHAKLIHTKHITLSFVDIEAGSTLPEHSHFHEQTSTVLEGRLELTVDGTTHILEPGNAVVIPSNVLHSAFAPVACKVLDVFSPIREDYKF